MSGLFPVHRFVVCITALLMCTNAGAAVLNPGDIVIADGTLGGVAGKLDPATGQAEMITSGAGGAFRGVALDAAGQVYVTNTAPHAIERIDPLTGGRTVISSGNLLNQPWGVVVEPQQGTLLVSNRSGGLVRVDPLTGAQSLVWQATASSRPQGIALAPAGHALLTDGLFGLWQINPTTGDADLLTPLSPIMRNPEGVVVGADGFIYVADPSGPVGSTGAVLRIDPVTGAPTVVTQSRGFMSGLFGIANAPGGKLYVSDDNANRLFLIDPVLGTQTPLASSITFPNPSGIAVVVPEPSAAAGITLVIGAFGLLRRSRCQPMTAWQPLIGASR